MGKVETRAARGRKVLIMLNILATRLRDFMGAHQSLRRKTILGSHWLLTKSLTLAAMDVVKTVVFARILCPTDYGLMALAMMVIGLLEACSTTGIEIMIQRDDETYAQRLPSYWTLKVMRGLLLAVLAWALAPPLAHYYQNETLVPVVRLLAVSFLLKGCGGFGAEIRARTMEFRRLALAEIAAALPVLALSLFCLLVWRNIWALAIGYVLSAAASVIVSYALFPWRPRFHWDGAAWKRMVGLGGSIVVINIMNYVFANFDQATIGKLLTLEQLGFYARAYFLASIPAVSLANVIAPVLMPAFRHLTDDAARLRQAFVKSFLLFAGGFIALGALLFVFSKAIILLVYGQKWLPLLPLFRVLLLFGIVKAIATVCPAIFFLRRRHWLMAGLAALMAAGLSALCIPLTQAHGTVGTAWAVVTAGVGVHGLALALTFYLLHPRAQAVPIRVPAHEDTPPDTRE